MNLFIAIIR